MEHPDKEKTANDVCNPTWIHLNHLVSYCTKSAPGLESNTASADNKQVTSILTCNRQYCVFRLLKR